VKNLATIKTAKALRRLIFVPAGETLSMVSRYGKPLAGPAFVLDEFQVAPKSDDPLADPWLHARYDLCLTVGEVMDLPKLPEEFRQAILEEETALPGRDAYLAAQKQAKEPAKALSDDDVKAMEKRKASIERKLAKGAGWSELTDDEKRVKVDEEYVRQTEG